jgi:hypothetical protein
MTKLVTKTKEVKCLSIRSYVAIKIVTIPEKLSWFTACVTVGKLIIRYSGTHAFIKHIIYPCQERTVTVKEDIHAY